MKTIFILKTGIIREILIIYQSEIDCIPDRQSPMTSTHLNVMVKIDLNNLVFEILFVKFNKILLEE